MEVNFILREDADIPYQDHLSKGECVLYVRCEDSNDKDKVTSYGLIMCCPKCGKVSSGPHKYNIETKSLSPSIVHGIEGCGFHGYLTDGIYYDLG